MFGHLGGETERVFGAVTNKTRNVFGGDKFVHVEANQVAFAAEINFGESFGEFGFADTGGTEK